MRYRLQLKMDGREVPGEYRQQVYTAPLGIGSEGERYVTLSEELTRSLSSGQHSLDVTVNAEAVERGQVVAKRTLREKGIITLLPEGKPSVALVSPQSLAGPVIAPGFSGKDLTIYLDGSPPEWDIPLLPVLPASNMGYCYRLLVWQGGREIPLGEMAFLSNLRKWDWAWLPASPPPQIRGDRVDVVFRPDAKLGAKTIWITQAVNKGFVVKGAIVQKRKEPR